MKQNCFQSLEIAHSGEREWRTNILINSLIHSCVPVKVLPPANVSVTVTEDKEYELRWIKHTLRYDFIKQRYQVEYWENNQYKKVSLRKCRSPGFLFTGQTGKAVSLTFTICASSFFPDSPEVKYQQ